VRRALTLPSGRRAKWVVLVVWLAVLAAAGPLAGRFESVQKNENSSFLPGSAESVKALDAIKRFPSGELTPAVVVVRRAHGLTAADRAEVKALAGTLTRKRIPGVLRVQPAGVSKDSSTALLVAPIRARGDSDLLVDSTKKIRRQAHHLRGSGLAAEVTGPAGFSTDAIGVFSKINGTLLLATGLLVFVLLILIYRSPIFWLIPLLSVVAAELTSRGVGYGLAKAGVTINGQAAGILGVLVFGVGTDYALLIVSRYREELRREEDKHVAMRTALARTGPTVLASALTVIASLLCLALAQVNGTAGLGPIGALGVALAALSMLTLLPALLVIAGRRAFWPFVPRYGGQGADSTHGLWRRVGDRLARRPRLTWIGTGAALGVMCLGLLSFDTGLTQAKAFRGDVESVRGQDLLAEGFPAGTNAPTTVVVPDAAKVPAVTRGLKGLSDVIAVRLTERGAPGVRVDVTLREDPYSTAAFDRIPAVRKVAKASGGPGVLVGGPTAEERDLRVASARDSLLIPPIVIVVVFLILAVLLRALLAPLLLVATVILSYGAALGVAYLVYDVVFGFVGSDPSLPLFAFIFLVGLGIDYNIFLMTRVREEAAQHGTQEGTKRALAVTGAVITSAGIVLAGTFATLAVLPLVQLTEIGFAIAFGVVLDTFLVRSVLVPALVLDVGDAVWWPGRGRARR
jgi:RND superfamily putative drug exporter